MTMLPTEDELQEARTAVAKILRAGIPEPIMSDTKTVDAVLVAYLHPNVVSHNFSDSLMRLFAYDIGNAGRVVRGGGPIMFRCGPIGLVEARNKVMAHFLDESDADWLWMIDSDMGFAPDIVDRLVSAADPKERPVVGALCFGQREAAPDGMQGWTTRPFPTLYDWARKPDGEFGFRIRREYRVNTLTRVAGTGGACLLVHRSAAQAVRDEHGDEWFTQVRYTSGQLVAEDLSFCYRLNATGLAVHVHTGARTTHHKEVWLDEAHYWRSHPVPPASDEVAVIVPVLGRPQNAAPFMQSLRASTGLATVHAIVGDDDPKSMRATAAAWRDAGAETISGRTSADAEHTAVTFAEKVNVGYRYTRQPWLFITGDDVAFRPGWLDHAQHVASTQKASVIGTNDLGNPRVMSGEHATHLLISRAYVDEHGASWDGPGVVCHEGYRHWFVDDEIVTAAKQRDEWAMALGSEVEHLHPLWGKAETDPVYERGQSYGEADGQLFLTRRAAHLK